MLVTLALGSNSNKAKNVVKYVANHLWIIPNLILTSFLRFNPPRVQPDNREQIQDRGDSESCLAVLNNFYGDGVKWHDVACKHEKPIICEDVEGHIAYARQTFPHINIP